MYGPMAIVKHREVESLLLVPEESLMTKGVPPRLPAFYNPLAKPTRDIAVLFYESLNALYTKHGLRLLDLLAGVGARGIRVTVETIAVDELFLNDANPTAASLAGRACELNGISAKCSVSSEEARVLLYRSPRSGLRYDVIDVDPFGSPVPFVDAALSALRNGGVIALTATDTSALTGRSSASGRRKYFCSLRFTDFSNEVAVRALFSMLVRRAAAQRRSVKPLFAHISSQYIRIYARTMISTRLADESLSKLGYLIYCPKCLYRGFFHLGDPVRCPSCGGKAVVLGPLWLGELFDVDLSRAMLAGAERRGWTSHARLLSRAIREIELPPYYYSLDRIADTINSCVPPPDRIVEELLATGYRASRTSFDSIGIKTDAPPHIVIDLVRHASRC